MVECSVHDSCHAIFLATQQIRVRSDPEPQIGKRIDRRRNGEAGAYEHFPETKTPGGQKGRGTMFERDEVRSYCAKERTPPFDQPCEGPRVVESDIVQDVGVRQRRLDGIGGPPRFQGSLKTYGFARALDEGRSD